MAYFGIGAVGGAGGVGSLTTTVVPLTFTRSNVSPFAAKTIKLIPDGEVIMAADGDPSNSVTHPQFGQDPNDFLAALRSVYAIDKEELKSCNGGIWFPNLKASRYLNYAQLSAAIDVVENSSFENVAFRPFVDASIFFARLDSTWYLAGYSNADSAALCEPCGIQYSVE